MRCPRRLPALLLLTAMTAGCSGPSPPAPTGAQTGSPGAVASQLEVLVDSGAGEVAVVGASLPGIPVRDTVVGGGGAVDQAPTVHAGVVRVRSATGGDAATISVELNSDVTWHIRIRGGAGRLSLDLSHVRVSNLELDGGATTMVVTLPAPSGTVPISVIGGANTVSFHLLRGTAVRVRLSPGIANARIGGASYPATGSVRTYQAPQYQATQDRYAIDMTAGAALVTLDTA